MRRRIKIIATLVFLLICSFFAYRVVTGYQAKKMTEAKIQTLPDAEFVSLYGDTIRLHDFDHTKTMVIIYFHPECEHCRYEAREIGQNPGIFGKCQLVMITPDDSLRRVETFCKQYNLLEIDNIEIIPDKEHCFTKTFGKTVVPTVFVYDRNRKLITRFRGETKPEALINLINL